MAEKKELLSRLDREIEAFDHWFRSQGAEPLARFEKSIIKSFLVARETGKFVVEDEREKGPCQLA
jgi:hypothetical protein